MPVTPEPRPTRPSAMRMGVFDQRGRIVRASLLWRSYGRMGFPAELRPPTHTEDRDVIYAGHLDTAHFGQFILEGLSRLWFAKAHLELPIVWACPAGRPPPVLAPWQRQLLEVVGAGNECLFITEPTRFRTVHVPQPGYRIKDLMVAQHAAFLAAYPSRPRDPGLRLWLSRSGLPDAFESLHARRLDERVAAAGWTVVRPETLPVLEQLELLATATRVAGEEGSAFHLMALLSDVRGLRVDVICRHPDRTVEQQNQNYQTIAQARGIDQTLHVMAEEHVLGDSGVHVRKATTTLAGHLEALGITPDHGPAEPSTAPAASGIVSSVASAKAARSILDISASREDAASSAAPGVVVDVVRPSFAVDPRVATDGVRRFEMPPHEYLELAIAQERRYDVIVLAGPWSAEQLVDLRARSEPVATTGTAWVLRGSDDEATRQAAGLAERSLPAARTALVTGGGRDWLILADGTGAFPWWEAVTSS